MKFLAILILAIVFEQFDKIQCAQSNQNVAVQQFEIWGDLGRSKIIMGSAKTKYAIPYLKRSVEFRYPTVSVFCSHIFN